MEYPRCKTCKWWGEPGPMHKPGVIHANCQCPKLDHRQGGDDIDGAVDADAYGGIYTGPDFGCIHHEPKQ